MAGLLTLATVVGAALVYVAGYAYLDAFYGHFDVSMLELNPSVEHVAAHAFTVYRVLYDRAPDHGILLLLLTSLALIGVIFLLVRAWTGRRLPPVSGAALATAFGSVVLLLQVAAALEAQSIGQRSAMRFFEEILAISASVLERPVRVSPNVTEIPESEPLFEGLGELHHLTTVGDTYFMLATQQGGRYRWVIRLPKSNAVALQVYQQVYPRSPSPD